jgi:hypothetical protein
MQPRLLPTIISGAEGTPVGGIVPTGSAAYVRLLHPARRRQGELPVQWRDVAVGSEIDCDSPLIAASRACVDAILNDERFASVEVAPEDRLECGGDILNPTAT